MNKSFSLTRRGFLQSSTALAALAIHPTARAARGTLRLAFIGVGGAGRAHFNRLLSQPRASVLAVADPDAHYRADAVHFAATQGQVVQGYTDFREMLAQHPGIDAVFIATPDHWHAPAALACMAAGKDVYCEAPLALTIPEGRAIVNAARQSGRTVQVGLAHRSENPQIREACAWLRAGGIGEIERVACFFGGNPRPVRGEYETPPAGLDWELYRGAAKDCAYHRMVHPYNFRYCREFGGGVLADSGTALFDIALWGAPRTENRVRVEAECPAWNPAEQDFPEQARVRFDFGAVAFDWIQGKDDVERRAIEPGFEYGVKFYGTEGELCVNRVACIARDRRGRAITPAPHATPIACSHADDFLQALRQGVAPACGPEIGQAASRLAHLGNLATRLPRGLHFDLNRERFIGDPEAQAMLKPSRGVVA